VLSVADAHELGSVDDLFLHLKEQRVVALRVKTGGLFGGHKALPLQDVKAVGKNAVTVEDATRLGERGAFPALTDAVGRGAVEGARVVTESGTEVGTVSDLDADFTTGVINGYVLSSSLLDRLQHQEHLVPASTVKSIGDKNIVVADTVVPA
jgi:uncharacterized protein YrrD